MNNGETNAYLPIEDYGVIGNLHTIALVSLQGSIDYLPFMRIDSPSIFLRLLDRYKGGHFTIKPQGAFIKSRQHYLRNTNILVTRFYTETGMAEITDYMPVNENEFYCAVVRQVKTVIGTVKLKMECIPAFDYARSKHSVRGDDKGILFSPQSDGHTAIHLASDTDMEIVDEGAVAKFTLEEGACCYFLPEAEHSMKERTADVKGYMENAFTTTYQFWKQWIAKCNYTGEWKEEVLRSALVLKLLISHKYGSPVAAGTFGLPEAIGGEGNWDYRYTWIRDAAFTMFVFMELGLYDEADKFIEWIKRQTAEHRLQLLYAVDGTKELSEERLNYLEGYKGSKPVRIGNAAHSQTQMDIYGELLDTVYIFVKYARPVTLEFWEEIVEQVNFLIENWKRPDHSIWEVRGGKQQFLFTRVMCWVAMDRAIKIAEYCSFSYPVLKWREVRDEIYKDVFDNFWSAEKETFVQYKGSRNVDASMLLMPVISFISPYSKYWQSTIKAIQEGLVSDVLVYRYKSDDDTMDALKGKEGTFTICSFWYIQSLAKGGETEKAKFSFEKLLTYANHLGLFAEQIGITGEHLGNFPQAFTHLSLISTAIELSKEEHLRKKVLPPDNAPKMK